MFNITGIKYIQMFKKLTQCRLSAYYHTKSGVYGYRPKVKNDYKGKVVSSSNRIRLISMSDLEKCKLHSFTHSFQSSR